MVGDFALTAVATDDGGSRGTSSVVNLTVMRDTLYPLISTGAVWKYLDNGSDQGTNWIVDSFDDSAWASGPAQLGYGDGDEATLIGFGNDPANKFVTTYFRRAFFVEDTSTIAGLILRLLRDDGAAVYLNDTEIFRSNMPTGAVSYLTLAALAVGGGNESRFYVASVVPGHVRYGTNVLAVEIHQWSGTSSTDISFDLELGVTELTPAPLILVDGRFDPSGEYTTTNSAEIRLETTFPNATMFYSLDGSPPSILYQVPFVVRQSATIRALAYNSNFVQSAQSGPVTVTVLTGYSLLATTGGGGSVVVDQESEFYLSNAVVSVTATPASGWTFLGWLGDASGVASTIGVPMTRNKCVHAVLGTPVATSVVGNGSLVVNPPSATYPYGYAIRLTAVPQTGNYFAFWGNGAGGTNNPLIFAVTNPTPTITAVFASLAASRFALTVIPEGNGAVNVNPQASFYNSGQPVTLTAVPAPGEVFLGWSGSATGAQNPLNLTMNQNKVIAATFSKSFRLDVILCAGQPASEGVQLTLTGQLGAAYRFDGSTDLVNWTPIVTLTNSLGRIQFNEPFASNITHRFYRAAPALP